MKTYERTCSRLPRSRSRAVGISLFIAACGGTIGKVPIIGSESHFLAYCEAACDAGLECIGGICTRACLTDTSSCSDLGTGAQCTNQSVEPGQVAVCDVSCNLNVDCAPLGTSHTCDAGYCRSRALLDQPLSADAGGTGGSGGSDTASPEPGSALCDSFRDQSPPPDIRTISVENTGNVPLYIQPVRPECTDPSDLVLVERDGQTVNLNPRAPASIGRTCDSCEDVIDNGWSVSRRLCPDVDCRRPSPVRIEPGQTLQQSARLEVVPRSLPPICAEGSSSDAIDCYARVIPQPGNYLLTVRAALSLDCAASASDCDCQPDAAGVCTNRSVSIENAPLVFPFPSDWYFQNQVLNIAAP